MNQEPEFLKELLPVEARKTLNDTVNRLVQAERKLERLRCQETILKWGQTPEPHETVNAQNTALKLSRALEHTPNANI